MWLSSTGLHPVAVRIITTAAQAPLLLAISSWLMCLTKAQGFTTRDAIESSMVRASVSEDSEGQQLTQ